MKMAVFWVLKLNNAISNFLGLLEAYKQCSSQQGINLSPMMMNDHRIIVVYHRVYLFTWYSPLGSTAVVKTN